MLLLTPETRYSVAVIISFCLQPTLVLFHRIPSYLVSFMCATKRLHWRKHIARRLTSLNTMYIPCHSPHTHAACADKQTSIHAENHTQARTHTYVKYLQIPWGPLKSDGILWNLMGPFEIARHPLKSHGILWDHTESFNIILSSHESAWPIYFLLCHPFVLESSDNQMGSWRLRGDLQQSERAQKRMPIMSKRYQT